MLFVFFLFKQKTAYEMRISDWSSDVCSSDLGAGDQGPLLLGQLALQLRAFFREAEQPLAPVGRSRLLGNEPLAHQLAEHSAQALLGDMEDAEIGRASCRERVCQYV